MKKSDSFELGEGYPRTKFEIDHTRFRNKKSGEADLIKLSIGSTM